MSIFRYVSQPPNTLKKQRWLYWNLYFILTGYNLFRTLIASINIAVEFRERGKPENPEKNPQSTGEIKNSTLISCKFDNQHQAIPRCRSPIQLYPHPTGLNFGAQWCMKGNALTDAVMLNKEVWSGTSKSSKVLSAFYWKYVTFSS